MEEFSSTSVNDVAVDESLSLEELQMKRQQLLIRLQSAYLQQQQQQQPPYPIAQNQETISIQNGALSSSAGASMILSSSSATAATESMNRLNSGNINHCFADSSGTNIMLSDHDPIHAMSSTGLDNDALFPIDQPNQWDYELQMQQFQLQQQLQQQQHQLRQQLSLQQQLHPHQHQPQLIPLQKQEFQLQQHEMAMIMGSTTKTGDPSGMYPGPTGPLCQQNEMTMLNHPHLSQQQQPEGFLYNTSFNDMQGMQQSHLSIPPSHRSVGTLQVGYPNSNNDNINFPRSTLVKPLLVKAASTLNDGNNVTRISSSQAVPSNHTNVDGRTIQTSDVTSSLSSSFTQRDGSFLGEIPRHDLFGADTSSILPSGGMFPPSETNNLSRSVQTTSTNHMANTARNALLNTPLPLATSTLLPDPRFPNTSLLPFQPTKYQSTGVIKSPSLATFSLTDNEASTKVLSKSVIRTPSSSSSKKMNELSSSKKTVKAKANNIVKPLSAYNYFFTEERERLLNGGNTASQRGNETNEQRKHRLLSMHLSKDRNVRRPHRKTHGKISFTTLSKHIGQKWRELNEQEKSFFRDIAKADMIRYRTELAKQKGQKVTTNDMQATSNNLVDTDRHLDTEPGKDR